MTIVLSEKRQLCLAVEQQLKASRLQTGRAVRMADRAVDCVVSLKKQLKETRARQAVVESRASEVITHLQDRLQAAASTNERLKRELREARKEARAANRAHVVQPINEAQFAQLVQNLTSSRLPVYQGVVPRSPIQVYKLNEEQLVELARAFAGNVVQRMGEEVTG